MASAPAATTSIKPVGPMPRSATLLDLRISWLPLSKCTCLIARAHYGSFGSSAQREVLQSNHALTGRAEGTHGAVGMGARWHAPPGVRSGGWGTGALPGSQSATGRPAGGACQTSTTRLHRGGLRADRRIAPLLRKG